MMAGVYIPMSFGVSILVVEKANLTIGFFS